MLKYIWIVKKILFFFSTILLKFPSSENSIETRICLNDATEKTNSAPDKKR